jgi:putative transposase
MTDDKIALRALLEKGCDATFLREMIGFAPQRLMELESEALCGAGHGERSAERRNQRNGYRDRDWVLIPAMSPGHSEIMSPGVPG